eukprot:scaffold40554_cov55-Phaeocystis_antarctica.AAC.2
MRSTAPNAHRCSPQRMPATPPSCGCCWAAAPTRRVAWKGVTLRSGPRCAGTRAAPSCSARRRRAWPPRGRCCSADGALSWRGCRAALRSTARTARQHAKRAVLAVPPLLRRVPRPDSLGSWLRCAHGTSH